MLLCRSPNNNNNKKHSNRQASQASRLAVSHQDHYSSVDLKRLVLGRVAVDGVVRPKVSLVHILQVVARERLPTRHHHTKQTKNKGKFAGSVKNKRYTPQ